MTRRKKLIAAALSLPLALALGVGLTVRRAGSDPLSADVCEKDLAAVFDHCEAGGNVCWSPIEGLEEACQAGCVQMMCPNQVSCTELDPIWCKPCDDEQGAPYWRILHEVDRLCSPSPDPAKWTERESRDFDRCFQQEGERMCPALAKKPYWEERPYAKNQWYGLKRCYEDLEEVVRRCQQGSCEQETGADKNACEAACLLVSCPEQGGCSDDDPVRCAPCEDPHGARFWRRVWSAEGVCSRTFGWSCSGTASEISACQDKWVACFVPQMERECPALAGTEWWRRWPHVVQHYENARPAPAPSASPDTP